MWTRKDTKILLLTGLVLLMARAKNRRFGLMIRLLLSRFSHVRLSTTPETAAHQAPLSLGFSRQEYWSGLPFPSPMHEREKWKWSRSVMSDSSQPHGLQPIRLLCPQDSLGKNTGVGCHFLLQWTGMLCVFKAWQLSVISILTSLVFDTPWFWSLIVIVVHYLNENFDIIYCLSSSKYHFSVLVKILGKTFQKQHSNASSLTIMCIS